MVLLCGIPSEPPVAAVWRELHEAGAGPVTWNQRAFADVELELEVAGEEAGGRLEVAGEVHRLEDFSGLYLRTLPVAELPELEDRPPDDPARRRCAGLHRLLEAWAEVTPATVMNRPSASASNGSKPYQAGRIRRHGFSIPPTLVTSDPEEVRAFADSHGELIYKSVSGVRSVVSTLEDPGGERLERIRRCPTQFQERVEGTDVRVHVVRGPAGTDVFATEIRSGAVDYRYAARQGGDAELVARELDEGIGRRCRALAEDLGLALAGVDLRMAPDGEVFCFEVNPSPGFTYYQERTGQPIGRAVARRLAGR